MSRIAENLVRVRERIQHAAERVGRPAGSIRLIAVTKTVSAERILEAIEAGVTDIGENRVQEALSKRDLLRPVPLTWHLIGHLQSNKSRTATETFHWIHSVDRRDLARRLNDQAPGPLSVLIEVKLSEEPAKYGAPEAALPELLAAIRRMERLKLMGLMTVPPFFEDPEQVRPFFRRLRELAERFELPEVSMGMSHDFEIAVEEGATMVRIGTALFGARP